MSTDIGDGRPLHLLCVDPDPAVANRLERTVARTSEHTETGTGKTSKDGETGTDSEPKTGTEAGGDGTENDGRPIRVVSASNAETGLEHVDRGGIDCVVSEYRLPGMDGLAFLQAVRAEHLQLPFVLHTAAGDEALASAAIAAGVTDYVPKADDGTDEVDGTSGADADGAAGDAGDSDGDGTLARRVERVVVAARTGRTLGADARERTVDALHLKQRAMDEAPIGITIADPTQPDTPLIYVNDAFERLTGYPRADILGRNCRFLQGPDSDPAPVAEMRAAIDEQRPTSVELLNYRKDGTPFWNKVDIAPIRDADGAVTHFVGFQCDVTDRKQTEQSLQSLHHSTREMMAADTARAISKIASETAVDVLGATMNGVHLYEDGEGLVPATTSPEIRDVIGEPPTIEPGSGIAWEVFETGERRLIGDVRDAPDVLNPETSIRTELILPLGEHGVFLVGSTTVDDFDEVDVTLAEILAANVETALEQAEHERELETLHEVTREMMQASTPRAVCALAIDASKRVLGYPITVVRLLDDETLVPVAQTEETIDRIGERPSYPVNDTPAGRAYRRGTWLVYDDLTELDDRRFAAEYDPGDARAAMYVPIGEHGVISIADTSVGAFDRSDVHLADILAANTEAALDRVQREDQLKAQRKDLARQNDRLEEFANVVSHDLRNPLTVAMGYLEQVADEADEAAVERIRTAHDRMERIIDDVLALARQGQSVGETCPVSIADVAETAWRHVETRNARLILEEDLGARTVAADRNRLESLFENLFRNAIEHGGPDVTVRVGSTTEGFFLADDGPGVPADEREAVFEHGYTTGGSGTGLGLSIVRSIVEAHGWTIDLTEADEGGARFEIRYHRAIEGMIESHFA